MTSPTPHPPPREGFRQSLRCYSCGDHPHPRSSGTEYCQCREIDNLPKLFLTPFLTFPSVFRRRETMHLASRDEQDCREREKACAVGNETSLSRRMKPQRNHFRLLKNITRSLINRMSGHCTFKQLWLLSRTHGQFHETARSNALGVRRAGKCPGTLASEWISGYGVPWKITSNQVRQREVEMLEELYGFRDQSTSSEPYGQAANGMVERLCRRGYGATLRCRNTDKPDASLTGTSEKSVESRSANFSRKSGIRSTVDLIRRVSFPGPFIVISTCMSDLNGILGRIKSIPTRRRTSRNALISKESASLFC